MSSNTNTPLPTFPGWEVLEKLGEGGMCAVYRARPVDGGPERALKVLMDRSEQAMDRFAREAGLLQQIDHPNIVRVHALETGPPPWLEMDLLVGRDLVEAMADNGPMDPERAARLFADLSSGLATVHAMGVRHRDVKPANVMLADDGVARLIDFGIARDISKAHVTEKGFVVGTASYLPPEVFTGEDSRTVQDDVQADVYAMGQTLWESLTGQPVHDPTTHGSEASVLVRIMRDKLERENLDPRQLAPHVPDDLADIVMRATARDPEDRTTTARALESDLRVWLDRRSSGERQAPVTWVDPRSLVPLRRPTDPTPLPSPVAPPAVATAPPPPRRRTGRLAKAMVGMFSMAGLGVIAVVLLSTTLVGGGLLWAFRPDATSVDQVLAVVHSNGDELGNCPGADRKGVVEVSVTVAKGKAKKISILESSMEGRTERCIKRILGRAAYPEQPMPFTVTVPVAFD